MDLFDLVPIMPPGPGPAKDGDPREKLAGGVVVFGLPLIDLGLVTVTDLSKRPDLAMLWLPVTFTLIGALVCVLGRVSFRRSLVALLGCLWWCLVAGTCMVVIDILIFPF
jgi:hypothetical protein